ncbi:MAG: flavodoxin family protein [Eubacteriales bacterium]|nr:flavodoxin family protein [Eubacteriales bacterium]MDD3881243.1 flavodoxin family protein [Eubacteriales bacterium]MDD4512161.1 flavodoxin family protein [Eubacteriales bacterium]
MKVLLFSGSPRKNGCTYTALAEIEKTLNAAGVETEILQIGAKPVRDCIACGDCRKTGSCVFKDDVVSEWLEKCAGADGYVFGTPTYYGHPSGAILSALDRMFFSNSRIFRHKPVAFIASARRAGTTATLDAISKHGTISDMLLVGSSYWNMVHGMEPEDVIKDEEGMQTMRNIGRNMAWLLKCLEAGKKSGVALPETERKYMTNFIR